ncbi:MAG: sugar-binding transcriptional regulator [Janthinobacterium lividum]
MTKNPASTDALPTRLNADAQREQLMAQVAKLFYDLDKTQNEIAADTGLTRWQVARLLREAREVGIVRIEIVPRSPRLPHVEAALQRRFGLREAIVLATSGAEDVALNVVTQAAGRYLAGLQPAPDLVAVSWGRTMSKMAQWLPPHWNDGVHMVLLNGAINIRNIEEHTNNVAERFAHAANGRATLLPVPAIFGSARTREAIEEDAIIADVLRLGDEAPVACFSMGALSERSVLVESGYLNLEQLRDLERRGAVGDILGRFVDESGGIVAPELDARTIGLRPERLRRKAYAIGVCVGVGKQRIARACVRSGYVNVLATDETTAQFLLEDPHV